MSCVVWCCDSVVLSVVGVCVVYGVVVLSFPPPHQTITPEDVYYKQSEPF